MKNFNKKGFTLIELLAVIVILAIVAAVTMTVIVPMINGKEKSAAVTSVKNMNQQIIGACQDTLTKDIMEPAHGTFSGTVVDEDGETLEDGNLESCTTGTCYVKFEASDLRAMNISGEVPTTFTVTINKCNITAEKVVFANDGTFKGAVIVMDEDGNVKEQAATPNA